MAHWGLEWLRVQLSNELAVQRARAEVALKKAIAKEGELDLLIYDLRSQLETAQAERNSLSDEYAQSRHKHEKLTDSYADKLMAVSAELQQERALVEQHVSEKQVLATFIRELQGKLESIVLIVKSEPWWNELKLEPTSCWKIPAAATASMPIPLEASTKGG